MTVKNNDIKKKSPVKKSKGTGWFIGLFWLLFLATIFGIAFLFFGIANMNLLGEIPDVYELENPEINVASEIYSADGKLLDKFELEKRIPIEYEDLPPHLVDALTSKEDERYYDHSGIDQIAVLRAIKSLGKDGGGSTITQQLAKQLFSDKPKNRWQRGKQKLKEWVVAVKLERLYTKEEIITLYLNKFDFIYGASGVEAAAKTYFNKSTNDLTVPESAMLVAMLNNPNAFNPHKNPEKAYLARNRVLKKMYEREKITLDQLQRDSLDSVRLDFNKISSSLDNNESASYYKYALRKEVQVYLDELEKESGNKYNLYRDGLKIYLTIDSEMQKMAENAMQKHLVVLQRQFWAEHRYRKNGPFYFIGDKAIDRIMTSAMRRSDRYKTLKEQGLSEEQIVENFKTPTRLEIFSWKGSIDTLMTPWDSIRYHKHILRSGLMSMNPQTGMIRAWVGGINWKHFKYDHVSVGRRQVGSTFKPIVYATAIDQVGYTPCHEVLNTRFKIGGWSPGNANGRYGGKLSLRQALAHSVNVVAARLIAASKPETVIKTARMMGIKSPIKNDYTIALGSSDLTLYEMVGAFSTFANGGLYIKPELVLRIEDKNGKILKEYSPKAEEVFSEEVAYTMVDLMRGVCKFGTAKRVGNTFKADVAGKTGTTNDNSDGWFIGIVPHLATGVWVGAEDRAAHFRSTAYGQGGYMALPIWINYMKSVYADGKKLGVTQDDKFEAPEGIDEKWSCSSLRGFHVDQLMGSGDSFWNGEGGGSTPVTRRRSPGATSGGSGSVNDNLYKEDEVDFRLGGESTAPTEE